MANQEQHTKTKEQASTYLYFSSLYFVTVGVLYLWGYWSTFNINILEYLSLADVLKSTAYPIVSALTATVIGGALGHLLGKNIASIVPAGGARNTRLGLFLRKFALEIAPLLWIVYGLSTAALLWFGPVGKWFVLPILFAVPVLYLAVQRGFLASLIQHDLSRTNVIFLLLVLPTLAYGHGRIKATAVLEGKEFKYVVSQIEGISVSDDMPPNQRLRLLGHAGDFLFLLHPAKEMLVISRFDSAAPLQLKEFKVSSQTSAGSSPAVDRDAPKAGRQPAPRPTP